MPSLITEAVTWAASIFVPNDGEGATKASLLSNFAQFLTNRTAYLKNKVDVVGVPRIAKVSSISALKALTGVSTDDLRHIVGNGYYRYNAAGVGPEISPWLLVSDTVGTWEHVLAEMITPLPASGAAPFFAIAGADGKVLTPVANQIIAVTDAGAAGGVVIESTTNTTYTAATSVLANVLNVQVGDKLFISFHGKIYSSGSTFAGMKLQVKDDASGTPMTTVYDRTEMSHASADTSLASRATNVVHTATKAGGCEIKLQMKATSPDSAVYAGPTGITIFHIRP